VSGYMPKDRVKPNNVKHSIARRIVPVLVTRSGATR